MQQKCSRKNLVFSDISFLQNSQGIIPSESLKVKPPPVASENMTNIVSHNLETV